MRFPYGEHRLVGLTGRRRTEPWLRLIGPYLVIRRPSSNVGFGMRVDLYSALSFLRNSATATHLRGALR